MLSSRADQQDVSYPLRDSGHRPRRRGHFFHAGHRFIDTYRLVAPTCRLLLRLRHPCIMHQG